MLKLETLQLPFAAASEFGAVAYEAGVLREALSQKNMLYAGVCRASKPARPRRECIQSGVFGKHRMAASSSTYRVAVRAQPREDCYP